MSNEELMMLRCLELAKKGGGNVFPNPMVGAIIEKNGKILSEGWHKIYGQAHAELNAVNSIQNKADLQGATMYVNLEPCAHFGKTPPCANMLAETGISRVIVGALDKNPKVAGKGIEILQKAGIEVRVGVLENECRWLNRRFYKFQEKRLPYVVLKWAQTADKFIDTHRNGGSALQITGEIERVLVHKWRSEEQAILVGSGTVLADNPRLDLRAWQGKNPIKIVLDRRQRISSENLQIFADKSPIILHENTIADSLKKLSEMGIISVFVEGGGEILQAFIDENLWDEARIFTTKTRISKGVPAPTFCAQNLLESRKIASSQLEIYTNN